MRGGSVIEYKGKRGVVWRIKYEDAAKRQVMETLGPASNGWTKRKAEAELRERLVRVERKKWHKPKPLTFADYAERWFQTEEKRRAWKPKTVSAYRTVRRRLVDRFGPSQLAAVRPRDVAAFIAGHELGASACRRDADVLYSIFKSAIAEELIQSNPVEGCERPKLPPFRPVLLEPHEISRTAEAFTDPMFRTVFLTVTLTGLRCSELQGLRWRDVSLTERRLRVVDSKSEEGRRSVAVPPLLLEELERHYQRTTFKGYDERVFTSSTGGKYWVERYGPAFKKALVAAGVEKQPRRLHDARHGALTAMAASGSSGAVLKHVAGHRSLQTTEKYLHLAGTVFHDDAAALEARQLSTELSTGLSAPQRTSHDPSGSESGLQT